MLWNNHDITLTLQTVQYKCVSNFVKLTKAENNQSNAKLKQQITIPYTQKISNNDDNE